MRPSPYMRQVYMLSHRFVGIDPYPVTATVSDALEAVRGDVTAITVYGITYEGVRCVHVHAAGVCWVFSEDEWDSYWSTG